LFNNGTQIPLQLSIYFKIIAVHCVEQFNFEKVKNLRQSLGIDFGLLLDFFDSDIFIHMLIEIPPKYSRIRLP